MSYYLGRIQQISPKNIIPCNYRICLCIEYLDMKEKRNFEKYKQCFITHEIKSKYNNITCIVLEKNILKLIELVQKYIYLEFTCQ